MIEAPIQLSADEALKLKTQWLGEHRGHRRTSDPLRRDEILDRFMVYLRRGTNPRSGTLPLSTLLEPSGSLPPCSPRR